MKINEKKFLKNGQTGLLIQIIRITYSTNKTNKSIYFNPNYFGLFKHRCSHVYIKRILFVLNTRIISRCTKHLFKEKTQTKRKD